MSDMHRKPIHLAHLIEMMPESLVVVNQQGNIVLVNKKADKLFGYKEAELLGKSIESLMPSRFRKNHQVYHTYYFENPKVRPMDTGLELFGLKANGHEFRVDISLSPLNTVKDKLFLVNIHKSVDSMNTDTTKPRSNHESPNCLMIINQAGDIILTDAAVNKLFGYDRRELLGRNIKYLVFDRHLHREEEKPNYIEQLQTQSSNLNLSLYGKHNDGHEFQVDVEMSVIAVEESFMAVAEIRDLSVHK